MSDESNEFRQGLIYALGCYGLWGFFPVYWKLLQHVTPLEILAHRMVWSLGFVLLILAFKSQWGWIAAARKNWKILATYFTAAAFLAVNWGIYIWAVNSGFVVETALGYFINPLLNVVFGATLLGERPRRVQWLAIGLAACGVLYLTFVYGQLPWIALLLAGTFGVYGLIKKKAPLGAIEGMTVETAVIFLPALMYLVFIEVDHGGAFLHSDLQTNALLAFSGVATALPLLLFAAAVRRMTLTALGIIQYMAPSIQFLLGVYVYHEPFTLTRLVGFIFIWGGLMLYTAEGIVVHRRARLDSKI